MELPVMIEKNSEKLEKTMKASNEIIFSLEDTKPWESKSGGCPYLERFSNNRDNAVLY